MPKQKFYKLRKLKPKELNKHILFVKLYSLEEEGVLTHKEAVFLIRSLCGGKNTTMKKILNEYIADNEIKCCSHLSNVSCTCDCHFPNEKQLGNKLK